MNAVHVAPARAGRVHFVLPNAADANLDPVVVSEFHADGLHLSMPESMFEEMVVAKGYPVIRRRNLRCRK